MGWHGLQELTDAALAASSAIFDHIRIFGLLMHVGSNGKWGKTEAMYCPARKAAYGDGGTPDLVLDCGGTASFTESFVYLGSLVHYGPSDHHDVEARIKKAPQALGAMALPHRITSGSLQKPTVVYSLQHYLASRTLLWAVHVARTSKNRLLRRLMLPWIREPRVAGGQEMT